MIYRKHVLLLSYLLACLAANILLAPFLLSYDFGAKTSAQPFRTPTPVPTRMPHSVTDDLSYPVPSPFVSLSFHGNSNLPEIALTFDDGPAPIYTNDVLSILRRYQVHATFFMLGVWVKRYPDLAKAVLADGHAIGDHTWSHPDLTKLSEGDIQKQLTNTIDAIKQTLGIRPLLFRPPYETYDRRVLNIAAALKLSTILWDVDPADWQRPGTGVIASSVLSHLHNGAIILMHDGGGDRSQTVQALSTIIQQALARGFRFVTIPQMLAHLQPTSSTHLSNSVPSLTFSPPAHNPPVSVLYSFPSLLSTTDACIETRVEGEQREKN
jgi:peptidoglycan/xylan/chitin deacetylase (PgdA/CDA1 family)